MRLEALKSFKRRDTGNFVKVGTQFDVPDSYGRQLVRNGLARDLDGKVQPEPKKVLRLDAKSKTAAPENKAVKSAPENKAVPPTKAVGKAAPSSVSPPARASRKTTVDVYRSGPRKGQPREK